MNRTFVRQYAPARPLLVTATLFLVLSHGPAWGKPAPIIKADAAGSGAAGFSEDKAYDFTDKYCSACHNDVDLKGGLDLTSLKYTPDNPNNFQTWVKVHDRLQAGEMPPKNKPRPDAAELTAFVQTLGSSLTASEQVITAQDGRAMGRRLNASEYQDTLRDLLNAPWLEVKDTLPEDGEAYHYDKSGQALDVSYVQMQRYIGAADYAIHQAIGEKLVQPKPTVKRYYAREDQSMTGTFTQNFGNPVPERQKTPLIGYTAQPDVRARRAPATVGASDPNIREQEAVGWVSSNYTTGFGSSWGAFHAPVTGRYRLRFSGYTIWVAGGGYYRLFVHGDNVGVPTPPSWCIPNLDEVSIGRRNEPVEIYAHGSVQNHRVGGIDLTPQPGVSEVDDVLLRANDVIVTDATRFFRSRPTGQQTSFTNPLAQRDGMPGVAFRWMEVEGPLPDESATAGYKLLFGDLPVEKRAGPEKRVASSGTTGGGFGRRGAAAVADPGTLPMEIISSDPRHDAERLLRTFIQRAYPRPVEEADVQRFLKLINDQMDGGSNFTDAMITGYTAVLSSPGFLFVGQEKPGRLDDYALATRLSLFLSNAEPDETLRALAAQGQLHQPGVLLAQAERLLDDPKSERFVDAFLDHWLDLRLMEDTTPSTTLYNDYNLDDSLVEAATDETHMYFSEMLRRNLPARDVVDSNFTYVNERLAAHYGIPGVSGVAMRRVTLPPDSPRGGLLTQASVLKVTANGTTTSPVIRGHFITERFLGLQTPPPLPGVGKIDPDIRGAVTIRQQLEKHRSDPSCAVCHSKMDPAGFALESFDILGGWRDRYRAESPDRVAVVGFGKNGYPFTFSYALPVYSGGWLPDGRPFNDIRDFKRLLLTEQPVIARNLAEQLVTYATGTPARFSDREEIEQILQQAKASDYGVRDIVLAIVQSDLFLNK